MYQQPQLPGGYGMMPPGVPTVPPIIPPRGGSAGITLDPSIRGVLSSMEREDLQKLDEQAMDSLLSDDKDLRDLVEQKLTETASNRSLADNSLTYQTRLEHGKRSLVSAHREADELVCKHRELRNRLQGGGGQRSESLEDLHNLLQSACLEAEDSAEALLERLLSNKIDIGEFVSQYTEARKLYHTRRAKADKLTEVSNQRIVQASGFRTSETPIAQPQLVQYQHRPPPPPPFQQQPPPQVPPMPSYYYPATGPAYQPYPQPPPYGRP